MYAALLLPSAKSGNRVPAWPFVALSVFFGAGGLLPYFALWRPAPPTDVYAANSKVTRFLESKLNAGLILLGLGAFIPQHQTTSFPLRKDIYREKQRERAMNGRASQPSLVIRCGQQWTDPRFHFCLPP